MKNSVFYRKNHIGGNKIIQILVFLLTGIAVFSLIYYLLYSGKVWLNYSPASFIIACVLYCWLVLTEFILAKYKFTDGYLKINDFLHPFGRKIKIEEIKEIKNISGIFSKKKNGLSIKATSGRSYEIFPENTDNFISTLLSINNGIKTIN